MTQPLLQGSSDVGMLLLVLLLCSPWGCKLVHVAAVGCEAAVGCGADCPAALHTAVCPPAEPALLPPAPQPAHLLLSLAATSARPLLPACLPHWIDTSTATTTKRVMSRGERAIAKV